MCPLIILLGQTDTSQNYLNIENHTYSEIEIYRQTLNKENIQAYEQALAEYTATPLQNSSFIKNRHLNNRYNTVLELPENSDVEIFNKIYAFISLLEDTARKKEKYLEIDCLYRAFMLAFWSEHRQYVKGFELAIMLEERLPQITEDEYPNRREAYFRISEVYYLFKDFDKSIELAQHALTDAPARSFTDCANIEARRIIGICYANLGQMDLSDEYFLSILQSRDMILDRPVYNAVALSNLGCNAMLRGEYHKAIVLDNEVLPFLKGTNDYGHIAGMYACQCNSYFGLGKPDKVGGMVDSILWYAKRDWYNQNKRLKQAYTNLSRYNGVIGNITLMQQYQDSLVAVYKQEEDIAASQYLLQAQQEVSQRKLHAQENRLQRQRTFIYAALSILFISFVFLLIILQLYRRQQEAYKVLAEKAKQWVSSQDVLSGSILSESTLENNTQNIEDMEVDKISDEENKKLAEKLYTYVLEYKPYKDPELTLENLAELLGISRNKLSWTINHNTGKNFKQYINELRVRETIILMADPESHCLSMEEIMEQAGFNSRSTFYNSFKKITGITPAQYWKTNQSR